MDDQIELRLRGEGIKPGQIRSHELAEILEAVESFVAAETVAANPEIGKEEVIVGLYEISDQSIGLKFRTTLASTVIPAFIAATQAVSTSDFESLSPHSLKPLQTVAAFAKRHNCYADIGLADSVEPIASIAPETSIPAPAKIFGLTQLVGKILRVGGKVPKAMIELLDGTVIYCAVEREIAQELGHQLYSKAVFEGRAAWDARSVELEEFSIHSFKDFEERDPLEVLSDLRREIGKAFEGIDDVTSFVSNLRRDGDIQ